MGIQYDLEDKETASNAGEPIFAYNAKHLVHTELAYDVPSSVDIDTFRTIMNACAMNIISQKARHRRHHLSDHELEEALSAYPAYDEVDHQSMDTITKNDYSRFIRNSSRKPIKGIEKWL